jgi:hypothetical protein
MVNEGNRMGIYSVHISRASYRQDFLDTLYFNFLSDDCRMEDY